MQQTTSRIGFAIVLALLLSACEKSAEIEAPNASLGQLPEREPGSHAVLTAPITAAENLEVIVSDVVIPPNAQVPRHYHPGEEFLYLIEGSATHIEEGKPDLPMVAGDVYVIPPEAAHEPIGGPEGGRAIVFRVHVKGQPERIAVPAEAAGEHQ